MHIFQNLSGSIVSIVQIISLATSPNHRTAAIYYFITALFILLACFDSYFALPLNVSYIYSITYESKKWYICFLYLLFQKFYRYYEHIYNKNLEQKKKSRVVAIPYFLVFKQCFSQCLNIFLIYFTTLIIFPVVLAGKYDMVTFQKIAIHTFFPFLQMYKK